MTTPQLETERLILRQIQSNDVQPIFDCWMNDEDVSRYMYWKSSDDINDAKEFVTFELGNIESNQWYRWIIETRDTHELIGTCLIFFNDDENTWDISYNLGKAFWGHGYITEAMRTVIAYGKNVLKIKRIVTCHAIENPASGNVIKKLGFQYLKDIPYDCNGNTIHTTAHSYELNL